MTNSGSDFSVLLQQLNGSNPRELILSYFDFLQHFFPDMHVGLYEYSPSPDNPILIAGDNIILKFKAGEDNLHQFLFPLLDKNSGYMIILNSTDRTKNQIVADYHDFFLQLFKLLLIQIESSREHLTEFWARLISQLTHDVNAYIYPDGNDSDPAIKIEQKKESLRNAIPRLLILIRPLQLSEIKISSGSLITAVIDKYPQKALISYDRNDLLHNFHIRCDPELIDMAITELLDNAVFASQLQGGSVIFSGNSSQVQLPLETSKWVQFEIRNPGASIPCEFLPQVKDPFFTTWKNEGKSGMGLALADRIVTSHGGSLVVKSDPQFGVKQIIYLPIMNKNEKV